MTETTFKGPLIVSGPAPNFGSSADYDAATGASLFVNGHGLLDPRAVFTYVPGGSNTSPACGFGTVNDIVALDQAPSALGAANIAAAQPATAGTPLVLAAASTGIAPATSITNYGTGTAVNVTAIDGVASRVAMGSAGPIQLWDPTTLIARNVRVTSTGNDSTGAFLVSGFDVYGFPMSELITGANAGVASGRKAFKYIATVTPQGTISGANVSVGDGDVYGLPLLAASFFYIEAFWNGALLAAGSFTPFDPTSPATSTTGDVRGTLAVPTPSDGVKRLQVQLTPRIQDISTVAGLFGSVQA